MEALVFRFFDPKDNVYELVYVLYGGICLNTIEPVPNLVPQTLVSVFLSLDPENLKEKMGGFGRQ